VLVWLTIELIVHGSSDLKFISQASFERLLSGIRHIAGASGAAGGSDGGAASEASSQDAVHLSRGRREGVRRSQPSRHCVSSIPLKNWSVTLASTARSTRRHFKFFLQVVD